MNDEARAILKRLSLEIEPETLVGSLSVSKQQMIEIARALLHKARVLIMERTDFRVDCEGDQRAFPYHPPAPATDGCGIVYISHRLEELQHIVDRVTIMRDGRSVTSMNFRDTTLDTIISYMVGRDIKRKVPAYPDNGWRKTIFEVRNLNAGRMVRDVSFKAHAGEIVGIAGTRTGVQAVQKRHVRFSARIRRKAARFWWMERP